MIKLEQLPKGDNDRRLSYLIIKDEVTVGEISIILYSDFFRQHDEDPTYIHEVSIVVNNDFRNKGVGKEAVKALIAIAREKEITPLWSIVHDSNSISLKLHESLPYIYRKPYMKYINGHEDLYVCYQLL